MDDHEVIELDLTQEQLCTFALLAHEADMKLNDWFLMVVRDRIQQEQEV